MKRRAESIRRKIRAIFSPYSEKPTNIAKERSTLYANACRAFGSWRNALVACGIDYERSRNNRKWTREIIKTEIIRIDKNGNSLRPSVLREKGMTTLVSAAEYHFGSWRRAVESCGLDYSFGRCKKDMPSC